MDKKVQNALHGTKTEELLKQAARGEAQAFTRYMLFSGMADQEGYCFYCPLVAPAGAKSLHKHAKTA